MYELLGVAVLKGDAVDDAPEPQVVHVADLVWGHDGWPDRREPVHGLQREAKRGAATEGKIQVGDEVSEFNARRVLMSGDIEARTRQHPARLGHLLSHLAQQPLPAVLLQLPVPRRHIVRDGEASHVRHCILGRDTTALLRY